MCVFDILQYHILRMISVFFQIQYIYMYMNIYIYIHMYDIHMIYICYVWLLIARNRWCGFRIMSDIARLQPLSQFSHTSYTHISRLKARPSLQENHRKTCLKAQNGCTEHRFHMISYDFWPWHRIGRWSPSNWMSGMTIEGPAGNPRLKVNNM